MTEVQTTAGLSRLQKQELLRKIMAERRRPRTEPASYAQERLWFLDRLEPGSTTYNMPLAWRLGGALDEAALERALGEIVRRHESLRTTFAEVDGLPVQVVAPFGRVALSIDDLSHLAAADREAEVRRRTGEEARRPFDLSAGPLFRAALLRVDEEDHVLLVSMHHIVSDGWSLGVLFRELSTLYGAYREGGESPLRELPVQYADYAVWQREQLEGESLNRQLSYWKGRLADAPKVLDLPTDRPRPAVRTHRGATVWTELSGEVLEGLQALGQSEGATLYMTLLGAFQVLLSKYSGSEDIVVGSSIAGRTRGEVEELIGFFINSLVLRTDLSGDPSFREVLRRVREVTLGAYEHQELPFEKLVAELQPERSMSHSPLFQVSFALNNAEGAGPGLPGLRIEPAYAGSETAKFDLSLAFVKSPRGLKASLSYSTDLFDEGTVRRMLGHLERVLEQVAADGDLLVSELGLLGEEERHRMLVEWNATETEYPAGLCIHQLFEAQAARTPGAAAVVHEGTALSYAELNARANRLAHHLVELGVGPDVPVGICIGRSLELVVGMLALLKAGGAYVALDPEYPDDRLRYMLEDSRPPVLLTQGSLRGRFAHAGVGTVAVDGDAAEWAHRPATDPVVAGLSPDHLAYVIYTSGSTGRPKGVMCLHRNVVNRLWWAQAVWPLDGRDALLQHTTVSFDGIVRELFWPLLAGARIVMGAPGQHPEPAEMLARTHAEQVTTLNVAASLMHMLVERPELGSGALKRLFIGSESLPRDLAERVRQLLPDVEMNHLYGPSEAATALTAVRCEPEPARATVPIGRPTGNVRVYLVDGAGRPVPVGVPGELLIGGAGVARGYLGRSDLTAERFVPDPFGDEPGARLYRTGDLARWLADGRMEFLGRNDFQVKIRGFRIEPGEVEAALMSHPAVREARVLAREDRPGEKQLVAYVVGGVDTGELRAHVRRSLPEYMVPAAFVVLEALPLTPNGKVDRDALPAPEFASAEETYLAPRTPAEEVLAGIWAEVLRLERVGVRDNFFELGGHSLLATRVVSRIRAVFGVELPLRALFEGPTTAEMAARVEEMRRAGLPVLPPVVPVERTGALPLSFAQERLWFIDQLEPGSAVYNIPMAWRLGGALDQGALERALGEIVRRHEALRTTFKEVDGSPAQVIAPFGGFALSIDDLSQIADADREAAVRRRLGEEARRAFDLAAGPLFRAALLRLDSEDHVLLLSMHHIVSDGWSMGVFFRELSALYEAYREGGESPLAEPVVQYADYAVWQREQLAGEALDRQLSYWRERLADAPALLELPTDHPRPAVQTYRGGWVLVNFSPELLERLQALGRSEGATLYMTLLGAFQVLLSRYGAGEDVVVGSPIAGRTRGEVEEVIGFFINSLVLRTDLSGDPSFREVLRRVREVTLGAYEHQDVPFEKLVAELQPERSLSHSPLFQAMFTMQNARDLGGEIPGLKVGGVGAALGIAKYDLSLTFGATAQGLRGGLNYSTDLFERGTAERMLGHLERVLEQVAADADVRLSRLALAGPEERARVVEEWNRTNRAYPRGVCIHDLFEAQVRERPGAVALIWGEESLTYHDLDARANRLAHHLVGLGVGPDARVGVLLERGAELIVSILAVLKAGGCYVPLDPGYPAERLRLMLADSSVRVLLSRGDVAGEMGAGDLAVVLLDQAADALASEPVEAPRSGATAENLAYIVYTSGSTGKPKGVMVAHRHVVQLVVETDYVRFRPGDRIAQASNASFDALTFEMFGALLNGATLVGIDRNVLLSPPALREMLREERITTLYQTTALLNQLSREQPDVFAPLREVLFGGQAVDADSVRRLLKAGGPERLLHMYGPTETTAWCSWEQVEEVAEDALTISVGRPTGNQRIYLLDAALNPVPVGVPGEAYVGGDGVVRGYLDRPGLTGERFVPDPFAAEPGARMYRTGDRLRWKADGRLEFIGRVDEQVKIRGFRIEPGEIEAVLSSHPEVREARVIVGNDASGEQRLVAYVVGGAEAAELREHLRESLPEYMVPAAFVALERLPLTPAGKLDVKVLPAPELGSAEGQSAAPGTLVEEVLAEIWAEVLRLERVGVNDNFFELGGHSLLAIRVVSRIRAVFSVELPLRSLFEGPTVAELARAVEEMRRADLPVLPPVVPTERTRALPLSFAQERLWFLDRLEPGSTAYNMPVAWRLGGALDQAALERSLSEIVRRHEALRTTFAVVDDSPVQVVAPFGGFTLPVEDLSGLGDADRAAAVRRRVGEEARRVFDLAAGPLFRASLLRLDAEDHVLLLSMHHVVSDGWSMGVLFRELSSLYEAYREGRESPLPELAVQYADYAVWQREQLAGEVLDRQLAYWKDRLAGAPELLEMPTDRPRPAVRTYRGAVVPVAFSAELLERLHALGRSEGATLYMTLLGAFQVLLSRYGGGEDVVVGSPIAGRTRREVEELIGFFLNTLVLRTDLSGDPSFRETLRRVREVTLGAYENQELPFEKLVVELQPERSLSHSPVFQALFTLQNNEGPGGVLAGLKVSGVGGELATAKFDLSLSLAATPQGLRGGLSYSTDLFERATIERMVGHLERVLEQVAAHADVGISRLALAGPEERAQVVVEWNRTGAAYSSDACVHELFAAQAARTPDAPAVVYEGESLTFRQLDERANRVANHLRRLGVGPEVRVGLYMERGLETMAAILGVMKAGGAYVPVDPSHPAERAGYVLEDSAVSVLLTQERLRDRLPARDGVRVLAVDAEWDRIAAESAEAPKTGVTSENLCYVIYTSGSTGRPKGVAMHHRGVVNYIEWGIRHYGADRGNGAPVFSSMAVDLTITNLLPLFAGLPVRFLPEENAVEALAAVMRERPDFGLIKITPTHLTLLTPLLTPEDAAGAVRTLVVGADFLPAEPTVWWQDNVPGVRLMNEYGPTETVVGCSAYTLPPGLHRNGSVPVGGAIQNLTFFVLDAGMQPVPVGLPGELYIGGAGVARGYLGRPALSAEKFVPDPFAGAGARMYRTGDRARWLEGGNLLILGRTDNQVKVRGYRVELGEIEATLRLHPAVSGAVAVVREDVPGDRRLVAYVVSDADPEELREHLRRSLPEYMVPNAFVRLETLPRTATGKFDPRSLPAPEYGAAEETYVAPRNAAEEVLAGLWAEVLHLERVGVHDNFFSLGGHSLLAVTLVARMRRRGLHADVRALFTTPTIAELAAAVGSDTLEVEVPPNRIPAGCGAITPEMLPLVELTQAEIDRIVGAVTGGAANVQDVYPLAPLQEGILFHHLLSRESDPYLLSLSFAFESREQLEAYLAALQAVVARHDILRTAVVWEGLSEPVQVVWRHAPLPVEEVEVDPAAGDAARQLYERFHPRHHPIDLSRAPMLRACVTRDVARARWVVLQQQHHLTSDHVTMEVLRAEIDAHLDGRADRLPAPLPFRNYVAQARLGVSRAEHEAFFGEMLGDVDEPTAPFGLRDVHGDGLELEQARLAVDEELGARLRERARALGVSAASVCHVAWAQVLARVSGRSDVVFGTVFFGRMQGGEGADRVLGPFINTLPIRIRLEEEGAAASVRRTQALLARLVRHEHASLALAQQCSGMQASEPLFSAILNYRHGVRGGKRSARLGTAVGIRAMERSNYPVNLSVDDLGDGFALTAQVQTGVGAARVCALMNTALGGLVEALETAPERPVAHVEVLSEAERRQLLDEWNRTERPYPRGVCVHDLFEAQVRERPGAVALVWGEESLTYRDLDARANRLAHHLVRLGVGPDARVGVLLERSAELIVSILAVLKAGGCYVPLDPGYPPERLRLMLADSSVRVLLSRGELASLVPESGLDILLLDHATDALASEPVGAPRGGATAESLAYIVYTSGSTGKPKGVMVAHRHVVQLVVETDYVQIRPGDRVAQASNAAFDALTFEAWGAFLNGATLVGIPRDVLLSPPALHRMLRDERITTLYQTTALLNQLSREQPDVFAPLREVLFGGQAVDADSVRRLLKAGGPERLLHMYGPTETTAWCSWEQVEHVAEDALTISVGRPTGNQRIYLLDAALNPVPVGVPGEAYVGGDGVVRGYLDRPGLTGERFVPDPFAAEPGARMYRTGDRLRWKADGRLEFIGRVDEQVKIRGFRIEPGEIEAVLSAHAEVREARVIVSNDASGEQRLVAYVVGGVEAEELRGHLRESLPEYMVPAAFVALERLPLTPAGKLDVKALPLPELGSAEGQSAAPSTPVEEVLAGIWAEVLRLERVGVAESFFELGGHSLLAIRVVSRIRAVFSVELPLRSLFEGPTVAELARAVEEMRRADLPVLPPVVPTERTGALPLSFAQERLWFLDQLEPGSTTYNMPVAWRLGGALDQAALERALGEIVRRHESLRTTFVEVDGSPVQVIAPSGGFALPVEDLSGASEADREAAVRRRAGEEARRPFDLAEGPLFRAALLRLDAEDHVLLLSMHHVVSDGWSMGVLFRELSTLYAAYREGGESPLPELAVQYADYAVWQREQLAGEALDRQLSYWRERLADVPALLELPTDHPRPPVRTDQGATVPLNFSPELLERLRELARSEGATLNMVVLGAFQVLLSKYSGSEDIVVGSPIAGRTRKEVEELIGFFVNTLVLRTDLGGDPGFREVLGRVREATLGAYEHQDLPFDKLVAELQPERSLSHSPLFQVSFTLGDAEDSARGLAELSTRGVDAGVASAKFDLSLALAATVRGLRGELSYRTDLFDRGTIVRLLGHLERVLEQVAGDPARTLSRLALLGEAERSTVVEEWNRTGRPYPRDASIHELFQAQVRAYPGVVALVRGGEQLTYAELDARANRLAHHLAGRGVGLESRVGVLLEHVADLIVSVLAILKAGGAYVPLDPRYPAERLAFMLEDSAAGVLLTQEALRGRLPVPRGVEVVSIDGAAEEIRGESAAAPESGAGARTLAYVIYTSGSTGTPKGVGVEHRSVVRLVRGADYADFGPDTVVLQAAPISFDASTLEIWGPLLNGGRVVMPGASPSLEELARTIAHQGVTMLWLTASLFSVMVQERLEELGGVRQLLAGGDVLPVEQVRTLKERFPHVRLINGYGPTENTTFTCCHTVPDGWSGSSVPIGRPISNTRVYVLDRVLRPVPVGVPGELCTGGDGVSRGYLGHPARTAERFVPDPFATEPGARMYRTGDRVRWMADGTVEYLGRLDQQVKVRGFRIEPGEIEAALTERDEVREARVIVREDEPGEKRLVAYVVGEAKGEGLREHLRRTLPGHMVPAAVVVLDRLPLTPNGKLDRKALPAPEYAAHADRYVAPRTPVEEVLAEIWAEVLGLERVGVEESFFDLGGHSLLATRVVSRIRAVFAAELPLRALFEGPTIAELAERVEEMRRADLPALPPVVPAGRTGALPLSFAQERLWFLDRLEPGSTAYNMAWPLRLRGTPDIGALERALGEIVRRHEALRTTFGEVDGSPVQVIAPFRGFALPVEDLSGLGEADREAAVRRRAGEEALRPFNLRAGPIFGAALLRLGDEDHALLVSMHHIVSDGWSMGVLFRELSSLYAAYREGGESPLPELAAQYADYAVWQREQLAGEALDRQLAYWRERLAGAPELLELPTDHPRPPVRTYRGATVPVNFSPELLERLQALGRHEGATLYMTLLSAFQVLLSKHGGGEDVVVGSPIAGRTRREVEELIGFFVNTLVLRTDLSGDPSFRQVLRRVREVTLGAYEHQDVPFEKLVAELQPERSLSHSPLFQVMFTLQDAGGGGSALPGLHVSGVGAEHASAKFDLSLGLAATAQGLRGALTYSTDLFETATIERMAGHLERVLEQVASAVDVRLSRLDLLGEAERALVLEEWNRTEAEYPADLCIHQLFEAQAARTPGAVAVRFEDESLTYDGLNERANRLAHYLRRRGVGPEVRVGICLERSLEMVVCILAVLKAGGAYVPLDPGYPAERLAFILADSATPVLLTEKKLRGLIPPRAGTEVLTMDGALAESESAANPESGVTPDTLAYVIYTSGSTGRPKGVMNGHRGVVNRLWWMQSRFRLGGRDVVLQKTPFSFDVSVWEFFWPLQHGACLVMARPEGHRDPAYLREVIERRQVTTLHFVPSMLQQFVESAAVERCASLMRVVCSGEALPPALVEQFHERFPSHVELHNLYGPTEAAVDVSWWPCRRQDSVDVVPIGRPILNTRLYVLDAGLQPVPVGAPGELYIGGVQVARGYLNRPALTASRFVPDHLGAGAGARLYATGDRARWRADGAIEYLGRLDDQVKIRGFRIEPGEIEAALRRDPGVTDCVVMARGDAPGDRRLVAYVVGAVETDALRAHLRQSLPEYMVPGAFVVLEALPLTSNGKVDRKALPAPAAARPARRVEPGTGLESRIAALWAELLGVEAVGAEDNFFDLGGHSLLLARLQGRLAGEVGREVPLVDLFHYPTVRSLARALQGQARGGAAEQGEERAGVRQAARARLAPRRPRG